MLVSDVDDASPMKHERYRRILNPVVLRKCADPTVATTISMMESGGPVKKANTEKGFI